MTLSGKRILVVGGEEPEGRSMVVALAEAGADVAIASTRNDTQAEFAVNSALNELWAMGRQGVALVIDASDAEQLRRAVEQAERELGGIDGAVDVTGAEIDREALRDALGRRPVRDAGQGVEGVERALAGQG
jgi:NAD(P)-dependent dehydrogenase (short-subunit alcohol dehydrogenase family)